MSEMNWANSVQQSRFRAAIDSDVANTDAVMERDRRLTGKFRGQSTNPEAPAGFEVSNPWKV